VDLTVRLVGTVQVLRGSPPAVVEIGSPKERRLLAMLAAHRPHPVPADRLVGALWPGPAPHRPVANVATLVSRLRARLGPAAVEGDARGYRLGAAVEVDLDRAELLLAEAARHLVDAMPGLAATAAAGALALVDGADALTGELDEADWVLSTRRRAAELVRRARHHGADAALRLGEPEQARRLAEVAIESDRYDETALRLLLAAGEAAGEPARAISDYHELRAHLVDELGVEPSPRTRAAYLAVLRERPPAAPEVSAVAPSRPALVGRAEESARLLRCWDAAATGGAAVAVVAGEAGIGKTRLVEELGDAARAAGARVAVGRCHATERSLFLQPVVDALGGALDTVRAADRRTTIGRAVTRHGPALASLFPDLGLDAPRGPAPDSRRVFEAVGALLRGLTTDRPLLLVLDDLHNAGLATVELVVHLARRLGGARLLVVATVRLEEGAHALDALSDTATRIDLGPLPVTAVATLAERAGHAELTGAIVRRTRGHPLFVVEILRGLADGEPGVPASLRAAVQTRVRRAGPEIEELLRAGAVLGATVDPEVLAGLLGIDPGEAARRCERAAGARLLVVAARSWEFANDLLHEVLYATTSVPLRRAYHRRAADLLTDTPEAVAAHASAVEDWPRAARALLLAGQSALALGGAGDAETLLHQALDASRRAASPELVSRVLLARARAREGLESFDAAWADLRAARTAAREAGDRRVEMAALRQLGGDVPMALGRPVAESTGFLARSLHLAEGFGDRGAEADVRARLAVLATHRLAFTEALDEGARAVRAGRAAGGATALVTGLDGMKTALAYLGHVAELAGVVEELEPLVRRADDRWRLHWTVFEGAFTAVAAGRWDDARARIAEAVAANRRSGYRGHEAWFAAHLGWVARLQGDLDGALRHGREAVALAGSGAHRWWAPTARALLAASLLAAGRTGEARATAVDAVAQLDENAVAACRLRCLAVLAETGPARTGPARTGPARTEPAGAPDVLLAADRLLGEITAPPGSAWLLGADVYLGVGRAWLARGRPDRARAAVTPLLVAAERHGWAPLAEAATTLLRPAALAQ
jgi:DNA-binding SARP family transcriptional activator/tetratricopeptide (TPR) repeat protein